ncbi:hypothetical protein REPUB_Repub02eG0128100 [Reevesia pubescens]
MWLSSKPNHALGCVHRAAFGAATRAAAIAAATLRPHVNPSSNDVGSPFPCIFALQNARLGSLFLCLIQNACNACIFQEAF